jgi:hypothetical protein
LAYSYLRSAADYLRPSFAHMVRPVDVFFLSAMVRETRFGNAHNIDRHPAAIS